MGLKKYEIITVGSDKRVRALRSWAVGGRYVNIGDVGGIVYDEKTLSQDGLCWLFRGNFGFPGARIGGDSIVDVGETALSATGAPAVDILGYSVVVGSKLQFAADQTAANGLLLGVTNFEPGTLNYAAGSNWEEWKQPSANYLRTKDPIFMGGAGTTLKLNVPGYTVQAYVLDRDGKGETATAATNTGAGVTLTLPAGQYFTLTLAKNPVASIALSDVTTAAITLTGTYETKLSIVDSRLEINPANSTAIATIKPGGTHSFGSGAKYPEAIIRNSKVSVMAHATANREIRLMGQVIGSTATLYAAAGNVTASGQYGNVKNLMITGIASASIREVAYSSIQATDCDNFVVSPTIFPGLAAAQTANTPFIFQGCNVPNGKFYHHAQIANTYKNIDFVLAQSDLGKAIASGEILASSEVEGMYRLYSTTGSLFGGIVEGYDSVKSLNMAGAAGSYGTTIYKDAYLNGKFDLAGTNVFGSTKKHDTSNTQDVSGMLVKGLFNATTNGSTISGVAANNARAVVAQPFRVSGAGGVSVSSPAGVECNIYLTDAANKILLNTGYVSGTNAPITPALTAVYAYVAMRKTNGSDILSTDEFKGVTVTVYNGCEIINTGATAVNMKGNIRVEDNATLINAAVVGTGYFGGNSVVYYNPAVWAALDFTGTVHMKDNAVFAPIEVVAGANVASLDMRDNAVFAGSLKNSAASYNVTMADEARGLGTFNNSRSVIIMRGNSFVAAACTVAPECRGLLVIEDDARIENGDLRAVGHIVICGKYKQTAFKTWTGKRTITDVNEPEYDNNVKTQYDF